MADLAAHGEQVATLINNAGFGLFGRFAKHEPARLREMIDLNVGTLTDLCRAVAPGMIERSSGAILNVASTAAFQAGPGMAVYFATKAYVLSLTEALHEELKPHGIKVVALCPGPTRTEFGEVAGFGNGWQGVRPDVDELGGRGREGPQGARRATARSWSPARSTSSAPARSASCRARWCARSPGRSRIELNRPATPCVGRAVRGKENEWLTPTPSSGPRRPSCRSRACRRPTAAAASRGCPAKVMAALGLSEGDVIEIEGKRITAARAIRPYHEDDELDIIRLDGLQRANAGAGSGDFVEIRKAESPSPRPRSCSRPPSPISGCRARPMRSSAPSPGAR